MNHNLFSILRSRMPDRSKLFIQTPSGPSITYGDMLDMSGCYASVMVELGVAPGDRVAVQVEKSPEALLLYLGCLRAGAVYLPLNPGYTATELAYFLADSEPSVFVCCPDNLTEATAICERLGVSHLETLGADGSGSIADKARRADSLFRDQVCGTGDLAALLYTSGTTGRSKGAMITHGNLSSNAQSLVDCWGFDGKDVLLHALPIFHTHGLFVATNVALMVGASLILLPRFDPEEIIRHLPDATTMMGVPTFYSRLLSRPGFTKELVGHIRLFVSGSAPLSAEVHKTFERRTGHAILERYGMTETNMITSNPLNGARRAGTVGFALPGVEVRVTDRKTGAPLGQGDVGMIELRGPNVFKGYWRMPDKTKADFSEDGFFITGDLGLIDASGYLVLAGRDKDLIISGGLNVYPAEIENALDAIEGIVESAVIGVPHSDFGEATTAVVVKDQGVHLLATDVREILGTELAKYKVPKRVLFVESLPRNSMGKVGKKALRERYRDIYGLDQT